MNTNVLRAQPNIHTATPYPEIAATVPIDDILWAFFKYDVVCIRNMLPVPRIKRFYDEYIGPIYKQDDESMASNCAGMPDWEREQALVGWIHDDRLGLFSGG